MDFWGQTNNYWDQILHQFQLRPTIRLHRNQGDEGPCHIKFRKSHSGRHCRCLL
jgi:hypothetical protein